MSPCLVGKSLALQVELYNPFNDTVASGLLQYIYIVCIYYISYIIIIIVVIVVVIVIYIKLVVIVDVSAGGWGEHEPIYIWEDPLCTNQTIDPDILR